MKAQHTPEPWKAWQPGFNGEQWAFGPHGKCPIGKTLGGDAPIEAANADRIVACVNACAGLADPAADLAALREALRDAYEFLCSIEFPGRATAKGQSVLCAMRDALARVEGGQS